MNTAMLEYLNMYLLFYYISRSFTRGRELT